MRSVENKVEYGVWRMRSVEMRGVEKEECGKCGVWKIRSVKNFNFPFQYEINK